MLLFLVPTQSLFMGYLQLRSHAELVSLGGGGGSS